MGSVSMKESEEPDIIELGPGIQIDDTNIGAPVEENTKGTDVYNCRVCDLNTETLKGLESEECIVYCGSETNKCPFYDVKLSSVLKELAE